MRGGDAYALRINGALIYQFLGRAGSLLASPTYERGRKMQPFMCPVCFGCSKVSSTLYQSIQGILSSIEDVSCWSCDGKGIVWGPPPVTFTVTSNAINWQVQNIQPKGIYD